MAVVSLAISGVLLVAIICISVYGWVTLPADARVPIHYGFGSFDSFVPKAVGLTMWPLGGALVFGVLAAAFAGAFKAHHPGHSTAPLIVLPLVLAIVCFSEYGAISAGRRNTTL